LNGDAALLQKIDFTSRGNGYDKQEVDDFLETVSENYTKLQTAYDTLSRQHRQKAGELADQRAYYEWQLGALQQARNELASQCAYYEWQLGALNAWIASYPTQHPVEGSIYL
jgi:DivIVA domain-containing protein